MTLLKFVDSKWGPIGSFNWFATHGTSMSRTNSLVSGDNKGAAARFMEDWFKHKANKQIDSTDDEIFDTSSKGNGVPRRISTIISRPDDNCKFQLKIGARNLHNKMKKDIVCCMHHVSHNVLHDPSFCRRCVTAACIIL